MSTTNEIKTYFGRCRCCLNYGYLKNMWEEHQWEGEKEIYVEMLVKCFALTWEHSDETMEHDQICESCIKRLRDAHVFKKVILDSQEELLGQLDESGTPIKIERAEYDEKEMYAVEIEEDGTADRMYIDEPDDHDYVYPDDPDDPDYTGVPNDVDDPDDPGVPNDNETNDVEYEQVEYLEDDVSLAEQSNSATTRKRSKTAVVIKPDTKWPQKLPRTQRYKTYKQYSEEDLRECLDAVRNAELTYHEASIKYKIPQKTIVAKCKLGPKDPEKVDPSKLMNKEKMFKFIQEVKIILTYTNATPFKSKANFYYCAYCFPAGPCLDDADELRTHTRTQHLNERTQKIEYAMRPHWLNEIIKLDIDCLLCVVCCTPINNWNDMFKHLKKQHKVILDQAYTRAIPYALSTDLKCALCKESFTNYMHLDGHMNAHYNNYVCDDCGDTFLSANRLKQHIKIHDIGKFACSECPKVFTLSKYKKKHEESVHKHLNKFKCRYCEERFTGEYSRHLHLLEKHKDKVKVITCETCGKNFTWKSYYMKHIKQKHSASPNKHICPECGKKYFFENKLKEHMLRHTGEKHFPCKLCSKRYISSGSLKHHMNWHKRKNLLQKTQEQVSSTTV